MQEWTDEAPSLSQQASNFLWGFTSFFLWSKQDNHGLFACCTIFSSRCKMDMWQTWGRRENFHWQKSLELDSLWFFIDETAFLDHEKWNCLILPCKPNQNKNQLIILCAPLFPFKAKYWIKDSPHTLESEEHFDFGLWFNFFSLIQPKKISCFSYDQVAKRLKVDRSNWDSNS